MGLSLTRIFAAFAVKAFTRKKTSYNLAFLASEASTAVQSEDGNLVTLARSSDGVYTLTLSEKYKRIYPFVTLVDKAGWSCEVSGRVEGGAATNVVTITVADSGTPDDPEKTVCVHLDLVESGGT